MSPPADPFILFVYGTLKRGQKSHHFIADQEFLGEAVTMPFYRLYSKGWHPAMVVDADNGLEVKGEVCGCDLVALSDGSPELVVIGEMKRSWTLLKTSSFWLRSDSLSGMDRGANRCGVSLDFSTSTSV